MSVFDFIREAGRLLTGAQAAAPDKPGAPNASTQDSSKPAPAAPSGGDIKAELKRVGLPADDIDIKVEGDTVYLKGKADSGAMKQKLILASGNIAGIGKVREDIEAGDDGAAAAFHTVKKGETMSKIAQDHYGAASKYPAIFEANKPMLTDANMLDPGQVLRIPPQA